MSSLCSKPYDGSPFHWDKSPDSLQWSARPYIISPSLPLYCVSSLSPSSQSTPNSPQSYFLYRQVSFCFTAQPFFVSVGLSYMLNSPTYSTYWFKYHPLNNESFPVHCSVYFKSFSTFSLPSLSWFSP